METVKPQHLERTQWVLTDYIVSTLPLHETSHPQFDGGSYLISVLLYLRRTQHTCLNYAFAEAHAPDNRH